MKRFLLFISLIFTAMLLSTHTALAAMDGFNSGAANWTTGTTSTTMVYQSSGGEPGGNLKASGTGRIGVVSSAAVFIGDYVAAGHDEISLDFKLIRAKFNHPNVQLRGGPQYSGWARTLSSTQSNLELGVWHHMRVTFDPDWTDQQARNNGWNNNNYGQYMSFHDTVRAVWRFGIFFTAGEGAAFAVDNVSVGVPPPSFQERMRKQSTPGGTKIAPTKRPLQRIK